MVNASYMAVGGDVPSDAVCLYGGMYACIRDEEGIRGAEIPGVM